jgi:serine/threonine-protein kinase
MTGRWGRLERIYHEAGALPEAERPRFLEQACADDPALRREVETMLRHADTRYLEEPIAAAVSATPTVGSMTGRQLRVYEIGEVMGAGGMGEVYRARDTRLGRDVAIKVLPTEWLADPGRRSRFEREARVLASLNHPHIAHIHELDTSTDVPALVMELVEGETLRERITVGPIPIREILVLARQMADGLEAAHEAGVIHRDFKPENVKITSTGMVKILDFGIAKSAGDRGAAPTITDHRTKDGAVLGTAPYVSPEQARSKPVDRRTDIWAFGCVLYEMATGCRAFAGNTWSDTVVAILEHEVDWRALPADAPAALIGLIRRCLEKDPRQRLRDMGDARLELDALVTQPTPPRAVSMPARRFLAVAGAVIASVGVGISLGRWLSGARDRAIVPRVAFSIRLPDGDSLVVGHPIAISPDGLKIVYAASRNGRKQLYVRALDHDEGVALPGTNDAELPVFSPDGRSLAFAAEGKLKRTAVDGGVPAVICDAPNPRGIAWGSDDRIVFAPDPTSGLMRVRASGGAAEPITTLDTAKGERSHRWPHVLPSGNIVFTVSGGIHDVRIDGQSIRSGRRTMLIADATNAYYLRTGYLLYVNGRGETFMAPFDAERMAVSGPPVAVPERPAQVGTSGDLAITASSGGTLAYVPFELPSRAMVVVSPDGSSHPLSAPARAFRSPRVSPDGRRIAAVIQNGLIDRDIWVFDVERETVTRVTLDRSSDTPLWTHDSATLAFSSRESGVGSIRLQMVDTNRTPGILTATGPVASTPHSWLPDSRTLLYSVGATAFESDTLWTVTAGTQPRSVALPASRSSLRYFYGLSADGRWLAYDSNETGRWEVYITAFPGPGITKQVSQNGGESAAWAKAESVLFYRRPGGIERVRVGPDGSVTTPVVALTGDFFQGDREDAPAFVDYDVWPDGSFLMLKNERPPSPARIQVVVNWGAQR